MSTHLCITVRWLGDRFHGFIDGTESIEWPPSPFRLFQGLLASAHRHGMTEGRRQALAWLERQQNAPQLLAVADPATGVIFDHWVPDNDNLVAHRKGAIRKFRPVLHVDRPLVHYIWPINPADQPPIEALDDLVATLGWLGWAVDSAFATATLASVGQFDSENLPENPLTRFQPAAKTARTDGSLRVAKPGTTAELERLHTVNRISFSDQTRRRRKKWPKVFDRYIYTTSNYPAPRRSIIFRLLDDELEPTRYPQPLLAHIAAVARHAAIDCMEEGRNAPSWIPEAERGSWVCRFVRGKKESKDANHQQISYVPLPSIGHDHSDAMIRNVMLVAPIGCEQELEYVAARLDGVTLEFKDEGEACDTGEQPRIPLPRSLQRINPPKGKFIDECYLGRSKIWQSVTPVILDEHIDKKTRETKDGRKIKYRDEDDFKRLIILALERAGIETPCQFTWQTVPFYKNCLSAHRYDCNKRPIFVPPKRLDGKTAVHLRLTFEQEVPGPITLGAGRHCGFGLMSAVAHTT